MQFKDSPKLFTDGKEHINAGYVGETTDGYVIVGLRGTLLFKKDDPEESVAAKFDWLQDFEANLEDWKVGDTVVGKVEKGFGAATSSLWPDVKKALGEMANTTMPRRWPRMR